MLLRWGLMGAIRLRPGTLIGGALALWLCGAVVASVVLGALLQDSGLREGRPWVALAADWELMRRPQSLSWSPLLITIAPPRYEPTWRAGLASLDDTATTPSEAGKDTLARERSLGRGIGRGSRERQASRRSSKSSTGPSAVATAKTRVAAEQIVDPLRRPMIWVTRVDERGRKYRCLVPVARWEARAMATVDWHLRLAGMASGAAAKAGQSPEDWLDSRFCEGVSPSTRWRLLKALSRNRGVADGIEGAEQSSVAALMPRASTGPPTTGRPRLRPKAPAESAGRRSAPAGAPSMAPVGDASDQTSPLDWRAVDLADDPLPGSLGPGDGVRAIPRRRMMQAL
jgi:hypothetical protein